MKSGEVPSDWAVCWIKVCSRIGTWIRTTGKDIYRKTWVSLQRKRSNSAFHNGCSELSNCNWRSCQLKENGWRKPGHYIHKAGAPVPCSPCSCPSDIRPTLTLSLPIHSIQKLKQWKMLVWYESSESLVSVTFSHRLCWSAISLSFLPEFIGELKDQCQRPLVVRYSDRADSPLQSLAQKFDNNIRIKQHLKLTQSGL